jgi:hypothetical protein
MKKSIGTTPDPEFAIPTPGEETARRRSKRRPGDAPAQAAKVPGSGGKPGTEGQQETTQVQQPDAAR